MSENHIAAVILAAGRGQRLGGSSPKALTVLPDDPRPLVRRVADTIGRSRVCQSVVVITGHESDDVQDAIPDVPCLFNPLFKSGMASSIRTGVSALPGDCAAVLIVLADMPFVSEDDVTTICGALSSSADVVVPMHEGQQGNPVLWTRRHFPTLMALDGDRGAKAALSKPGIRIAEVACGPGVLQDIDTPEDVAGLSGGTLH